MVMVPPVKTGLRGRIVGLSPTHSGRYPVDRHASTVTQNRRSERGNCKVTLATKVDWAS